MANSRVRAGPPIRSTYSVRQAHPLLRAVPVQEAWLRTQPADVSSVENLDGWLTTVVSRLCLDVVRARRVTDPIDDVEPVSAFIAASRDGEFDALVELLDPGAVFRTYRDGAGPEILTGASTIADAFMAARSLPTPR